MKRRGLISGVGSLVLLLVSVAGTAQELVRTPAETKALFTANIPEHSTWPAPDGTGVPTDSGEFVIGVVGGDPNDVIDPIRQRIKSGKGMMINERPVTVVDLPAIDEQMTAGQVDAILGDCSLLFFSADSEAQWLMLKPYLERRAIMTISELAGFAQDGGMVEYEYDPGAQRMYMVFNMRALKQAGLLVSARLLSLKISRPINQGAIR